MSTRLVPAPDAGLIETPVERTGPSSSPSNDEFDAVLEEVSAMMSNGRVRSVRSIKALAVETTDNTPAATAVSGCGYRGCRGSRIALGFAA